MKPRTVQRMSDAFRVYLYWTEQAEFAEQELQCYVADEPLSLVRRLESCELFASIANNYLLNPPIYTCNPDAESGE